MNDVWPTISALGIYERVRMRHCRGCKYLTVVGHWGCCDYLCRTGKRRPCKFGGPCSVKVMKPGYVLSEQFLQFVKEWDRKERIEAERKAAAENQPEHVKRKRGRPPKYYHKEFAKRLYNRGYYLFEIAEVMGVDPDRVGAWSKEQEWKAQRPKGLHFSHHNLDRAKAEFKLYLENRQAEQDYQQYLNQMKNRKQTEGSCK